MSRALGLEEPPTPPKQANRRVTEAYLAEISGIGPQAFSELVARLRPLDEVAQAAALLTEVQQRVDAGDLEGARALMRVFTVLHPRLAEAER
jgi:hypothetical protein